MRVSSRAAAPPHLLSPKTVGQGGAAGGISPLGVGYDLPPQRLGGLPSRREETTYGEAGGAKRPRHYLFLEARQVIVRPSLDYRNAWGAMGCVVSNAKSYVKKVRDRAIVLRNVETDELKVIPYYTRFSDGYYRQAIKKMRKLCANDAVFLTLTLDPKRFISLADAKSNLQKGWNKLLTVLRKRVKGVNGGSGAKGVKPLSFVKVVEFQKNGSPHIHALFFGVSRLIDADELREFWDKHYGAGTMVYLKRIKNDGRQVVAYLTKYIKKYLDAPDIEFKGADGLTDARAFNQLALSWALNLRAFSTSKGILDTRPMTNSNGTWVFLGVFDLSDVWSLDGLSYSSEIGRLTELNTPLFGG